MLRHASNVFSFWQLSSIKLTFHVIFLLQLLPGIPERRRPFHCLSNFLTGSTALIIAPAETLETYCITSCSQRAPKLHKSPTCFTGNNLKWYFISAVFKKSSVTTPVLLGIQKKRIYSTLIYFNVKMYPACPASH